MQPDDYWFAEALLYTPFRSEEELEERVAEAAKDGYILLNEQIQAVKSQVMEHLESTEEARFMIQEALNNDSDVGAVLNPSGEQDNDDCELEELLLHPDYQHLDPAEYLALENNPVEKTYRPIVIDSIDLLKKSTRELDKYQRWVVERGVRYAREVVKARSMKNPPPKPATVIGGRATPRYEEKLICSQF